jgi:prevent-host-death family protein
MRHVSKGSGNARTVSAAEFKARCLELIKDVQQRRAPLVVTKHGRPIVRITAVRDRVPDTFGALRGTVTYRGDIVAPDAAAWGEHA